MVEILLQTVVSISRLYTIDNKLTFNNHCILLMKKIQKMLHPLRRLTKDTPSRHLETIFNSFILPHFDYCDSIYCSANKALLLNLERLQYQAALLVSGAIKGSNKIKVFSILNWQPLSSRRNQHMIVYAFKVIHQINNISNLDIINTYKREVPHPNLRTLQEYSIPPHYSSSFRNSTVPSLITLWNSLPRELKILQPLSRLKNQIKSFLDNNASPTYNPTTKSNNILRCYEIPLNRMRCDLYLNSQKFRHNFVNIQPVCTCGCNSDSVAHYFFKCPLNQFERDHLLQALDGSDELVNIYRSLTRCYDRVNFLLHGSLQLRSIDNAYLLHIVSEFIFLSDKHYCK